MTRHPKEWENHPRCNSVPFFSKRKSANISWVRDYSQLDNKSGGGGVITLDRIKAEVPHQEFWKSRFVDWKWEIETERIFRQFVKPGGLVVDIGAWIGPTVLFGIACGASRIVAVEPNPSSYAALLQLQKRNLAIASRLEIVNMAISDRDEVISMGLVEGVTDTSRSGIAGNDFTVKAITFDDLIRQHAIDDADLVKIDIEGSEVLLGDGLSTLLQNNKVVHLSIHLPFFPIGSNPGQFAESLSGCDIFHYRGKRLGQQEFADMIEAEPRGGFREDFFEVLILAP